MLFRTPLISNEGIFSLKMLVHCKSLLQNTTFRRKHSLKNIRHPHVVMRHGDFALQ